MAVKMMIVILVLLYNLTGQKLTSLLFKKQKQKKTWNDFSDFHVTVHSPTRENYLLSSYNGKNYS